MADVKAFLVAFCLIAAAYPFLASRRFLPRYEIGRDDPLPSLAENQKRFDRGRWLRLASRLGWLAFAAYLFLRWWSVSDFETAPDSFDPYMIAAAVLFSFSLVGATLVRYRWEQRFCVDRPRFREAVQPLPVRMWALAASVPPILLLAAVIATKSLPWTIGFALTALALLLAQQKMIIGLLARTRKEVPSDSPLAVGVSRMALDFDVQPKRFLLIPSLIANAGALPDGTIIMTAGLREIATDEELVAILAHEFSHAKDRDAKKIQRAKGIPFLALGVVVGILVSVATVTPSKVTPLLLLVAISTAIAVMFVLRLPVLAYQRRLEFKCDAEAAAKGYGPDLASGLTKLHRYMGMPPHWGVLDAPFLTHPSLADRVAKLEGRR